MITSMFENAILYIMELTKLFLACIFITNITIKHKKAAIIATFSSILFIFHLSYYIDTYNSSIPEFLIPIFIIILCMNEKKRFGLVFLNYFICCLIDIIFCTIMMFIFHLDTKTISESFLLTLLLNSFSLVPIILIILLSHRKNLHSQIFHISGKIVLLIIVGAFTISLYIAAFQVFVYTDTSNFYMKVVGLAVSLSSFIFILISVLLLYKQNQNTHLKHEAQFNQHLLKTQENYYTMLQEKDKETRAFRHDIQHHIYSMHILHKNHDYAELGEYLEQLDTSLQELNPTLHTENTLVNAITMDINSKYTDVALHWTGQLPDKLTISSMDICTIFSNLLKNAFEAASQSQEKTVDVTVRMLDSNILVTISNPTITEPTIIKGNYQSNKSEPGHGYGIKNVKECMEKNNGFFKASCENGIFTVEVMFVNVIPVF